MIMPISAVSNQTKPTFKGAVKNTEFLNDAVKNFTRRDKMRWETIKTKMQNCDDKNLYEINNDILQIGKTIIKSIVIKENDSKTLFKDVYNITKGGSVHLLSRETVSRAILETFEEIYK